MANGSRILFEFDVRRASLNAVLMVSAVLLVLLPPFLPSSFAASASVQTKQPALPTATGLLIPLYIYPGSAWTAIMQQKAAHPSVPITVVVNPDSGPGSTYSSVYGTWISKLRSAGITVLGYVSTEYAARSLTAVEADISAYKKMYTVDGIFLDQMSNKLGHESYYSTLTSLAHSDGFSLVVGNPGTGVPSTYFGTTDVLLVYESPGLPTTSRLQKVTMGDPPVYFAVLSYDIPTLSVSSVQLLSQYASMIYITSGTAPAPYLSLPGYLSSLLSDVQAITPTTFTISVASVTSSGSKLTGMRTIVYYQGAQVAKGFTSLSFTATAGGHYTVCVENYQNLAFSHWDDGLTNPCRAFQATETRHLVATYNT